MVLVAKLKQIFKRLKNISLKYIDANKNIIWGKEITAVKIVIFIIQNFFGIFYGNQQISKFSEVILIQTL